VTPALWLLAAYGLAFFVQNKLPRPDRVPDLIDRLLGCIFCLGFHAGWITWLAQHIASPLPAHPGEGLANLLGWSFASAAFAYMLDTLARWFEAPTDLEE
jgi:hypothetical protein